MTTKRLKIEEENENVVLKTGDASGADYWWTLFAVSSSKRKNVDVRIYSFSSHAVVTPPSSFFSNKKKARKVILNDEQLSSANDDLKKIAQKLSRRLPYDARSYVLKLLQRNWHVVHDVEALFAIGNLISSTSKKRNLGVEGGTAWGCELFCLNRGEGGKNLFFFDQVTERWYTPTSETDWKELFDVPSPFDFESCGLIGSRSFTPAGKRAIQTVFVSL